MSINLITKNFLYEIGSGDFLIAFFDTIDVRLTKGLFKKSYPYTLEEFYNGHISYEHLDGLESELKIIRKKLKKFKPNKLVWDKHDIKKRPPWGEDISSDITDYSNYFVTYDGKDLFEVLFKAINKAKSEKSGITIKSM